MAKEADQPRDWTPASIREVATGFQASRVLLTAIELRIFSVMTSEGLTSAEVASRIGSEARATDRLLNALCAIGLLWKRQGRFRNTSASARFLDESSPEFVAGLGHTAGLWRTWSGLTETVRQGTPAPRPAINDRGDSWVKPFIAAMHYRAQQQAPVVAGLISLDGVARVLDVGGGSGAFAMAFVKRQPHVTAVVFDLPAVAPLAQRHINEAGLSDRITVQVGDYLQDPLPGGFDLVFLSAVVHSNGLAENEALLRSCAGALNPGGRAAVVDWVMDDDRVNPAQGAFFAINMLVGTERGDTFTEPEIRGWMTAAGLAPGPRIATGFGPEILIGIKPPTG